MHTYLVLIGLAVGWYASVAFANVEADLYVSPVVGEVTRTATARIVLPNPDGLWRPGLFVSARGDAWSLPAHAASDVVRRRLRVGGHGRHR